MSSKAAGKRKAVAEEAVEVVMSDTHVSGLVPPTPVTQHNLAASAQKKRAAELFGSYFPQGHCVNTQCTLGSNHEGVCSHLAAPTGKRGGRK